MFPPPEKRLRLLLNWLNLRDVLKVRFEVPKPSKASAVWSGAQWRATLGTDDDHKGGYEGGRMQKSRNEVKELLEAVMQHLGLQYTKRSTQQQTTFSYADEPHGVGELTNNAALVKEILWELYELNFRHELNALSNRFTKPAKEGGILRNSNQPSLSECFADSGHLCQIGQKQKFGGLAAPSLLTRAPHMLALCRVMESWPGGDRARSFLETNLKARREPTMAEMEETERWATKFYCQTFYETFGRPPLLPHRPA